LKNVAANTLGWSHISMPGDLSLHSAAELGGVPACQHGSQHSGQHGGQHDSQRDSQAGCQPNYKHSTTLEGKRRVWFSTKESLVHRKQLKNLSV
jgi:hypothetical protein